MKYIWVGLGWIFFLQENYFDKVSFRSIAMPVLNI
jgi:hypothetical protein